MSIEEFKDNLKLYCSFHEKKLIYKYIIPVRNEYYHEPIFENSWFKPYYTKEGHENSLDNIQDIVNEFTAMVYVYKNNLYSKYVGFCPYRRQQIKKYIYSGNIDLINEKVWCRKKSFSDVHLNFKDLLNQLYNGFLYDEFIEYIKEHYNKDSRIYKIFIKDKCTYIIWQECYICEWKYFCEIVECIYNFICYLNDKYNLEWNSDKYKEFIKSNFNNKYTTNKPNWLYGDRYNRLLGYLIELIIGHYFGALKIELENK